MSEWYESTLGQVCDEVNGLIQTGPFGSQLHQSDYTEHGVPVVMPKDIVGGRITSETVARVSVDHVDRLSRHKLNSGDIIYGRRGDIGRQALIRSDQAGWMCGTGCLRISLGESTLDPLFLHYYLSQDEVISWITNQAVGATMPNLNTAILRSVPVRFPDLPIQRRIAGILSAYDDLIENSRRRIKILEEMARRLYREWFVHFRFPGHEDCRFVESPLGEIPEGWEVKMFSELAQYVNGYAFKPGDWGAFGRPIIKIKELKSGISSDTPRNEGRDIPDKFSVVDGDILFSWSADLDAYLWSGGDGLLNQHLFNVLPYEEYSRCFCFHALKEAMPRFRSLSLGATMHHIKRSALDQVFATVPPAVLRQRLDELNEPIHRQLITLAKYLSNLRRTRDLLLPRLLSGQIDVEALPYPSATADVLPESAETLS